VQIILGRLEKEGLETDNVEVFQDTAMPKGLEAFFHVTTMSSGYVHDLGYWKVNLGNGKIVGVALEKDSEMLTFEEFKDRRLRRVTLEEEVSRRTRDDSIFRAMEKIEARIITTGDQLVPLLRDVIRDILRNWLPVLPSADRMKEGIEYVIEREIRELQDSLRLMPSMARTVGSLQPFLRDLSFYAAGARHHEEVDNSDSDQGSEFLKGLLNVLLEQYAGGRIAVALTNMEDLSNNVLFQAFGEWEYFARLPMVLQTPTNLMRQLLKMTRALYVAENFPDQLTDEELSIFRAKS
jgi:hypothetical protein